MTTGNEYPNRADLQKKKKREDSDDNCILSSCAIESGETDDNDDDDDDDTEDYVTPMILCGGKFVGSGRDFGAPFVDADMPR